jgi:hypothetical protein
MYDASLGATGWGMQLPVQFPNASPYNLPEEMWHAGFRGLGQDETRMKGGTAILVTGLIAAGAAGVGVLIGWLAERRAGKGAEAVAGLGYYRRRPYRGRKKKPHVNPGHSREAHEVYVKDLNRRFAEESKWQPRRSYKQLANMQDYYFTTIAAHERWLNQTSKEEPVIPDYFLKESGLSGRR